MYQIGLLSADDVDTFGMRHTLTALSPVSWCIKVKDYVHDTDYKRETAFSCEPS